MKKLLFYTRRFIVSLDKEQKKALKEKYKEHRRSIWRGETSSSKKDEIEPEDVLFDNFDQERSEELAIEKELRPDVSDKSLKIPAEEDTTAIDNQAIEGKIGRKVEQTETTKFDDEIDQNQHKYSGPHDEAKYKLVDKIKAQRRTTWAGESSSQLRLKDKKSRREIQDEKSLNHQNGKKGGITWKFALAVIVGITGAIGLGVLLGYILASYL